LREPLFGAVLELGRARALVRRHFLRVFQRAAVGETGSNPGGAKRVATDFRRNAGDPRMSTVNSIQQAFDRAGVVFLDTGDIRDGAPGLRLKRS
jgi:hypothetical protein